MKITDIFSRKAGGAVIIILIILILLPVAYSAAGYLLKNDLDQVRPFLEKPDAKYKECVRDTEYMRYHHWELLRAIREEIVRYGKRGDIGLAKCRECHTSRENFCNRCHDAVSMVTDCFGCHYYP